MDVRSRAAGVHQGHVDDGDVVVARVFPGKMVRVRFDIFANFDWQMIGALIQRFILKFEASDLDSILKIQFRNLPKRTPFVGTLQFPAMHAAEEVKRPNQA